MRRISLLLMGLVFMISCEREHPLAAELCDCYTRIYRANRVNDKDERIFWEDSCKTLHINILQKLEDDPSQKKVFIKAYRRCQ
tara:strand:- start:103 stop:351 length:249 start_codon:yes stop_codon:yes gene_type:complete